MTENSCSDESAASLTPEQTTLLCGADDGLQIDGCKRMLASSFDCLVLVVEDCDLEERVAFVDDALGGLPDTLVIVELTDETSMHVADLPTGTTHERVDPDNLARLGTAITDPASAYQDGRLAVCLGYLDPLIDAHSEQAVFKFLHVLTTRLDNADATVHGHFWDPSTKRRTTLGTPFDAVAETAGNAWQLSGD